MAVFRPVRKNEYIVRWYTCDKQRKNDSIFSCSTENFVTESTLCYGHLPSHLHNKKEHDTDDGCSNSIHLYNPRLFY